MWAPILATSASPTGQHGLRALDRRVADHVGERDYPSTPEAVTPAPWLL